MPAQRERVAEVGGEQQRQRARRLLLGAAVRILDEVARAFAEADQRGRRELDVQSAEARHDAGGQRRAVSARAIASRVAERRDGLERRRRARPGATSSNASVSSPSLTVICTRAVPTPRAARRSAPRSIAPRAERRSSATPRRRTRARRIEALDRDRRRRRRSAAGWSRPRRTTRCRRPRGSAGTSRFSVSGLLMRISRVGRSEARRACRRRPP